MPAWDWKSWAVAGWVAAIAAVLRFVNLHLPPGLVFDEVYYATEGQELLDHGVEWRTETDSAGNVIGSHADFVVHPPLGKWVIGLGIRDFLQRCLGLAFHGRRGRRPVHPDSSCGSAGGCSGPPCWVRRPAC